MNQLNFMGSFALTPGKFYDIGARFRKNVYERKDSWLFETEEESEFYDLRKTYSDEFNIKP